MRSLVLLSLFLLASLTLAQLDMYDPEGKNWVVDLEVGLGMGHLDRTVDGMEQEWFGVDTLRNGGEHDGAGIRVGFGRRLTDGFTPMVYYGSSALFSGIFFDNHGPFIPPELQYMLKEKSIGLGFKYSGLRIVGGYSFYSGDVTLTPDDREGFEPGEEWEGTLGDTGGFHLMAGFYNPTSENVYVGVDLIWRNIPIQLPETPTGITPEEYSKTMIEGRISLQVSFNPF